MRLEDRETQQDQQQIDREHAAERRRMMREAAIAFMRQAERRRMQREEEVAYARRVIDTIGDVYGADAYQLGGVQ